MFLGVTLKFLAQQAVEHDSAAQFFHEIGSRSYIAQYRTVQIGMPRQTGKSTALLQLYMEGPSLLICRNAIMASLAGREMRKMHRDAPTSNILTIDQLDSGGITRMLTSSAFFAKIDIDYLLVDEGLDMSRTSRDNLYSFAAELWTRGCVNKDKFCVIIVGT